MKISIFSTMVILSMALCSQSYAQDGHAEERKLAIIAPNDVICSNAGGVWNECGSGCGPVDCTTYLNPPDACPAICIAQCECPPQTIWQDRAGCVDVALACQMITPMDLCANTSGTWNECGSGCGPTTCDFMPTPDIICPAVCDAHCECPAGFVWDTLAGCMPSDVCGIVPPPPMPQSPEELCVATQGTVGCQPSNCTTDENGQQICTSDCGFLCICPEGQIFDAIMGCIADDNPPTMNNALCTETGGMIGCKPCEAEVCDASCEEICVCPEGMQYDDLQGCHLGDVIVPPPMPSDDQMKCEEASGTWNTCASACAPNACDALQQDQAQRPAQAPDAEVGCIAVCVETCECPAGQYWVSGMGCLACDQGENGSTDSGNEETPLDVGLTEDPNGNDTGDTGGTSGSDRENASSGSSEGSSGCQSNGQSSGILMGLAMILAVFRRRMIHL
jgi:hypothetical protein